VEEAMLSVRIPDELAQRFEVLSKETNRPKSYYIREALERAIEDLEDIYLAEARLEDLRAGRSRTYTLEEVETRLGLAD
jgi:RHH-type rel operon transcriptional repressor/antitoxin RelB